MTERVLIPGEAAAEQRPGSSLLVAESAWKLVALLGVAMAVVGWVDVLLSWYPAHWASLEWEVGTISSTFDAMPLGTLGLGLVAAAGVALGRGRLVAVLTVGLLIVTVVAMILTAMLALDVMPALQAVNPGLKPVLKKALLKTGLMAATYLALYAIMAFWLWRLARSARTKGAAQ